MKKLALILISVALVSCAPTVKENKSAEKNASYYYKIGLSYLNSGNNSQAIYYLSKAYELNPKNPEILNALGIAYSSVKEYKKAEDYFLKAIDLSPNKGELYTNLGVLLAEEKKYNKAIWYLKKAVENPEYKNKEKAFYNLALIYKKLENDIKYEEYLKKALSYNQYFVNAYLALGNFYISQGKYEDALAVFMKAYNIGIYIPEVYLGLGKSYYYIGKLPKAKYYFLKAKRFAGDNYFVANEADKYITLINETIAKEKEEKIKQQQAQIEKLEDVKQMEELAEEGALEETETVENKNTEKSKEEKSKDIISSLENPDNTETKNVKNSETKAQKEEENPNVVEELSYAKESKPEEPQEVEAAIRFYVQVGVYSNKSNALETVNKLKKLNLEPQMIKKNVDGKYFYFVIIGYFNSYLEASKFYRTTLKPNGFRGIVKFEKVKG